MSEFIPNQQAINERSQGKTIQITLDIKMVYFGFVLDQTEVVVSIYGLPESSAEIQPVSDSFISIRGRDINITTYGNNYDYPNIKGQLTHYYHKNSSVQFSATEQLLGADQ